MGAIVSSNKGKYQEYGLIDANKELMFTPEDTAREIMNWVNIQIPIEDSVLEPFKGNGVFYDKIQNKEKYYCEIDDGIDFFNYDKKVDWAISNPPFRVIIKNPDGLREKDSGLNYKNTFTRMKAHHTGIRNDGEALSNDSIKINAFIPIIDRTMEICNKGFFYLINHKLWSSLTVKRLKTWKEKGWSISRIKVIEIKKWYGRYYVVKFEKECKSLLEW